MPCSQQTPGPKNYTQPIGWRGFVAASLLFQTFAVKNHTALAVALLFGKIR
jgi:hypothetical protein